MVNSVAICEEITKELALELVSKASNIKSIIGHEDICSIINKELGLSLPVNRESVMLEGGDKDSLGKLLVVQFSGGRLPEGCKELPKDIKLRFFEVHEASQWEEGMYY